MPCTKTMSACHSACAHRRLVRDYRSARQAHETAKEATALGYATEGRLFEEGSPGITFKAWLEGLAQVEELAS